MDKQSQERSLGAGHYLCAHPHSHLVLLRIYDLLSQSLHFAEVQDLKGVPYFVLWLFDSGLPNQIDLLLHSLCRQRPQHSLLANHPLRSLLPRNTDLTSAGHSAYPNFTLQLIQEDSLDSHTRPCQEASNQHVYRIDSQ